MSAQDNPAVIIHARLSSSRLPGKVLRELDGQEMLLHQIERIRLCRNAGPLVIATSDQPDDDSIAAFCQHHGVTCFRGSLEDVTARMLGAADAVNAKAFVRLSGDSPFIDPRLIDTLISIFHTTQCDLATNVFVRSFPKGQSVEVLSAQALRHAHEAMEGDDREHVTTYFYRHAEQHKIANLTSGEDWGAVQLSVDTPQDFEMAERLLAALPSPLGTLSWKDITKLRLEQAAHD